VKFIILPLKMRVKLRRKSLSATRIIVSLKERPSMTFDHDHTQKLFAAECRFAAIIGTYLYQIVMNSVDDARVIINQTVDSIVLLLKTGIFLRKGTTHEREGRLNMYFGTQRDPWVMVV